MINKILQFIFDKASDNTPCTITSFDSEILTSYEMRSFKENKCPDCGEPLVEGPCGGLSINLSCKNSVCGSRFNDMGVFGVERISDAQPLKRK